MAVISTAFSSTTTTLYFERCGSVNLDAVLKCVLKAMKKRENLRGLKLIFFTAYGEGPVMATSILSAYQPKIIAVSFPPTYRLKYEDSTVGVSIPKEVVRYLRALDVDIISSRLPFEGIEVNSQQNSHLEMIARSLAVVCSSFPMCVQAVLQACDAGIVEEGEDVIGITGDCAAILTASSTKAFLSNSSQFFLRELLCKPSAKERPISRTKSNHELMKNLGDTSPPIMLETKK